MEVNICALILSGRKAMIILLLKSSISLKIYFFENTYVYECMLMVALSVSNCHYSFMSKYVYFWICVWNYWYDVCIKKRILQKINFLLFLSLILFLIAIILYQIIFLIRQM